MQTRVQTITFSRPPAVNFVFGALASVAMRTQDSLPVMLDCVLLKKTMIYGGRGLVSPLC
jgi:hypothetical protein